MKKRKKFHSMKSKITVTFLGLLLLYILMITLINGLFLEKYYISKKTGVLLQAEKQLETLGIESFSEQDEASDQDGMVQENYPEELKILSTQNNLSWVIITKNNAKEIHWGENERKLQGKLFGYIYDLDTDKDKSDILDKTDHYVIQQTHDRFSGMDYLECWGILDNENYFLIRTPLESIRESVNISNKFYFAVGVFMLLISVILIRLITKRITRPISELTELSRRMSDLDFEARYQSNAGNEIDILGESFNKMSAQLEKTVSELKSANLELQKDIENKIEIDRRRKEFLDNVSHELKTPIALVQGYAEGLKENISDDPESREFYCDVIMDEAGKMNKLVKNLLTLNQLESGQDAPFMERFDLVTLIRGVLQKMDIMIRQKEAQVIFEEQEPVYVWADEFKVEEVMTNYVSNALNHLEGEMKVCIRICKEESGVRVSVFNTGVPIPEKDLPCIWNKFYKVDKARTREYGGSGIGLSIVKAIMEGMHQKYGASNYDNGVEFWFTLDRK